MTNGQWHFDGQTIKIASDGTLLDGQHRLQAIVQTGLTLDFFVARNIAKAAQHTMDTGKKRSLADALSIAGEKYATALSAATTITNRWDRGVRGSSLFGGGGGGQQKTMTATMDDLLAHFQVNSVRIRSAVVVSESLRGDVPVEPRSVSLAAYVLLSIDEADAVEFFARLNDGQGLQAGSPILLLREKLFGLSINKKNQYPSHYRLALLFKAWNAYRKGQQLSVLSFTLGGKHPEKFPEPV